MLFEEILTMDFLASIDPTKRQRHFGHIPVFWTWIAQILEGNDSCQKAVAMIQSWSQANELPVPASSTSNYCQARQRLSEGFLDAIDSRLRTALDAYSTRLLLACGPQLLDDLFRCVSFSFMMRVRPGSRRGLS